MIRKITRQEAVEALATYPNTIGYLCTFGALIGNKKIVVVEGVNGVYLATRDLLITDNNCVLMSEELELATGGFSNE